MKKVLLLGILVGLITLLASCGTGGNTSNAFDSSSITNQDFIDGVNRWAECDYGEAYKLLQKAVNDGREKAPESPETAYMEIKWGEFLVDELGKYDEGLEYELSAYTTFKKLYGINDYNTLKAAINIAACDIYLDNYETAISQLQDLYEEVTDTEPKGILAINIAHSYAQYGDMDNAKKWFDLVNEKYVSGFKNKESIGSYYNNYGLFLCEIGEGDRAIEAYIKAIDNLPETNADTSEKLNARISAYINLASAYFDTNDDVKGAETLTDAYNLVEESGNEVMRALCMEEIARVLLTSRYDNSLYETAKQYLDKSLDLLIDNVGENHKLVAKNYNLMSKYYQNTGNNEKAVEYREKAIEIEKNLLLYGTKSSATLCFDLADAYFDCQQYSICIEYVDEGIRIIEELQGEDSYETADALALEAWAYCEMKERDKSVHTIEKAIELCNQHINKGFPKDSTYAYVMMVAGIVYANSDASISADSMSYKTGMDCLDEAETVFVSIGGENSSNLISLYLFRGDLQAGAGETLSARESYKKAYAILKATGADDDTIAAAIPERLLHLYNIEAPGVSAEEWMNEW